MIDRLLSRLEIPRRLRAFVRARESSLIVLAALVGAIAGVIVFIMSAGVDTLRFAGARAPQILQFTTHDDGQPVLAATPDVLQIPTIIRIRRLTISLE